MPEQKTAEKKAKKKLWAWEISAALLFFICLICLPKKPDFSDYKTGESILSVFNPKAAHEDDLEIISLSDNTPIFLNTPYNYAYFAFDIPHENLEGISKTKDIQPYSPMAEVRNNILSGNTEVNIFKKLGRSYFYSDFRANLATDKIEKNNPPALAYLKLERNSPSQKDFNEAIEIKSVSQGVVWAPLKALIMVSDDGAPSYPAFSSSSGFEELDQELRNYLINNLYKIKLSVGDNIITITP